MKKLTGFALLALVVLASFGLGSASAATNYEHKALNAARQKGCLDGYETKNIWVTSEVTSACFAGGFITTANIIYRPTVVCTESGCPTPMPIVLATVQFGCDDEIMSVACTQ